MRGGGLAKFFYGLSQVNEGLICGTYKKKITFLSALALRASLTLRALLSACLFLLLRMVSGTAGSFWSGIFNAENIKTFSSSYDLFSDLCPGHGSDDVRVPRIGDGQGADPEVLSTGGAQFVVVPDVVVHASLYPGFTHLTKILLIFMQNIKNLTFKRFLLG